MTPKELIAYAFAAKTKAYVPYSKFPVGAALLGADGRVYTGCNVECASYGGTICAERTALAKAVSEGCQKFVMLAVCADTADYCTPCGICRQLLREFAPDLPVLCCNQAGDYAELTVGQLLPHSFSL